jgi:hypothetical protein
MLLEDIIAVTAFEDEGETPVEVSVILPEYVPGEGSKGLSLT